ncbi:PLP-dependent aspartate aminotransferase family protein [Arcanobacterium sp. S3PF19]|uniref:trans-sulfuration enzyme family protein n=1 Tax=Arcanobacterium sp. S3PF19 TaxID=1219585 RepID=UPI00050F36F9|nr:aminotransferase class I/II-fold pyridoxal phosphate-dependent enzyme [Arcanobacterium sp. S3PF19]KGF06070.1 cystathionine gamma-synthase [Arcanobacterium sp. S3PF19]
MEINSTLLHGYEVFGKYTGSSSIPIYQCSTFAQKSLEEHPEYMYSRFGNPTRHALEEGVAAVEGGRHAYAFGSGMAAISACLLLFGKGDHVVLCKSIYGGTFQLAEEIMKRFGIDTTFVDETDLHAWESAIRPNTKALYLETPSNPLLNVTDIRGVVAVAKRHGLLTIADNTFMTPLFQRPLDMGVDLVIESATKFFNGHSDVVAGMVITNDDDLAEQIYLQQKAIGGILGPQDSWLIMRGMKTMGLRMEQSARSALQIAEVLEKNKAVKALHYPGLPSHPGYELHRSQATCGGAVLSFELKDRDTVNRFAKALHLPILAVSLGGVESILSFPAAMSHACMSPEERAEQGVTDGLLRLSVGVENTEDLIDDLTRALNSL